MVENLYLIGFMGSGKTTVGKLLAAKTGRVFCDMDEELERREQRTVSQIFAERGEVYFRQKEAELLEELLKGSGHIIALGGGTPVQSASSRLLQKYGARVVWLDVSANEVCERLRGDHSRPLLEGGNEDEKKAKVESLLAARRPMYQRVAALQLETAGRSAEDLAEDLAVREKARSHAEKRPELWVLNGPNLNFVGIREPAVYGASNYAALVEYVKQEGDKLGFFVRCLQSNYEGELVDWIQEAYDRQIAGLVVNPGALTHYSYTMRDALASVKERVPAIEVHLSEINEREAFRHISVTQEVCLLQISGLGFASYKAAMEHFHGISCKFFQKNS